MSKRVGGLDHEATRYIAGRSGNHSRRLCPATSHNTLTLAESLPSFRYMRSLGSPETIETVINALCEPDMPRLGQHYTVNKAKMRLGREVIQFDSIHVSDTTWRPGPHSC
jgi:hypothetical protein